MLARFAAALQRGQIQGIGGQGFGGGGGTIVVDNNCLVSQVPRSYTMVSAASSLLRMTFRSFSFRL